MYLCIHHESHSPVAEGSKEMWNLALRSNAEVEFEMKLQGMLHKLEKWCRLAIFHLHALHLSFVFM